MAECYNRLVEFRILGALEVVDAEGRTLAAGGGKQRALLAYLLLHANEVVPRDRLIDELWGESPPRTVESMLHLYLSRVRKLLVTAGPSVQLVTRPPGYVLELDPSSLDAERFRKLVAEGHDALRGGSAERAANLLDDALALWRGPALADVGDAAWVRSESARLEDLRLEAVTSKLEAELALGKHALVVAELEELVARHPLHERLRALLMLALYRAGRQAEALEVYQRGRRALVEELGLEPGEELRELERAILRQDRSLATPRVTRAEVGEPVTAGEGGEDRRLGVAALSIAVVLVLLAVAAAGFVVARGPSTPAGVAGNSVAVIDPGKNVVAASIAVGARPAAIATAANAVWVSNLADSSVSRIDAVERKLVRTVALGRPASALVADGKGVWAASDGAHLYRVDGGFNAVTRTVAIRGVGGRAFNVEPVPGAALGDGSLWAASGTGLVRVSLSSGKSLTAVETGDDPTAVAFGADAAWVTDAVNNTVTRVDPTGATQKLTVGRRPTAVAVGLGAVWVVNTIDDTVVRLDPTTRSIKATIGVGRAPSGIAIAEGALWVANSGDGTVSRIDPQTNAVTREIRTGGSPAGIAASHGAIWVTVQERVPAGRSGGSALVLLREDPGGLDPAITFWDWSWQVLYATCVKLMNYPDDRAPNGSFLKPEAVAAPPTIEDGGRTYVFRVPPRFRFSPPSSELVTARTFKTAIERSTSPRTKSEFAAWFLRDVVGMAEYRAGKARHLAGVSVRGNTLTVRLTRPSFDLTTRLSMPFFCAVPIRTPIDPKGVRGIPSAGPYYVASYIPGRRLILQPNPSYRGSRLRRLDKIVYAIGASYRDGVSEVERGLADYVAAACRQPMRNG